MKAIPFIVCSLALTFVLADPAGAQQRGRLEGDVQLEKGPLAANDFEKEAITTNPDFETVVRGGMGITMKKK